eukprot:9492559-Pyramimonas_sp.AAC.2
MLAHFTYESLPSGALLQGDAMLFFNIDEHGREERLSVHVRPFAIGALTSGRLKSPTRNT